MNHSPPRPPPVCGSKVRYQTRTDALSTTEALANADEYDAHFCPRCRGYHLSSTRDV
ncbi:hypothetical protein [Lolliginicoccus suaedae]|uniref:hypothetical protein n=1 Tax=Lolliginicoccus suaedae TaxID=2605429 RepID=UPI001659630F|nr:hypothetical protein [Lolliginicoccus suaedae]